MPLEMRVSAYAGCLLESALDQDAILVLGGTVQIGIWLNGEERVRVWKPTVRSRSSGYYGNGEQDQLALRAVHSGAYSPAKRP